MVDVPPTRGPLGEERSFHRSADYWRGDDNVHKTQSQESEADDGGAHGGTAKSSESSATVQVKEYLEIGNGVIHRCCKQWLRWEVGSGVWDVLVHARLELCL